MDPSSPLQIAAWAVAALIALFSLGGCTHEEAQAAIGAMNGVSSGINSYNAARYYAPPPTLNCITYNNYNGSRTVCQ